LGNAAGMIRDISVPGELTGINPMTESYSQNMGNTTGPLVAGLGAMPPRMVAGSPSFEVPGGGAVEKPLLPNMPELKQKGRRDPSLPPEEDIPFSLPRAMMPGAAGNFAGMVAQLPGGLQGPAQGPNTPVRNYPGMGYGPYGPGGGGLPPTPIPPQAAGFDRKFVS